MSSYQTFKTEILVRDKMVQMMESKGIIVDYKKLDKDEYIAALRKKVVEEANEIAEEMDRNKLIYEFADLLEVVQTLAGVVGISEDEISKAQKEKRDRSGGFEKRLFTSSVKISTDNPVIEYYFQRPNKYPKVSEPA